MDQISLEARQRARAQFNSSLNRILEKGSYQNASAIVLTDAVSQALQVSPLARVEDVGDVTYVYAGPQTFTPLHGQRGGYDVRQEKHSLSSVFTEGPNVPYRHGDVQHEPLEDFSSTLRTACASLITEFKPDFLVNPSQHLMRQAKQLGIHEVHLVVNPDDEPAAEAALKQEGMKRIYHKEGLAFLTRETAQLSQIFPRWIGLLLLPQVSTVDSLEFSVHRYHRWDRVKEQVYWYTSSYAYLNVPQTIDRLKIPRTDRLLASSFSEMHRLLPKAFPQHVGEYRYLDDYPQEGEEDDLTVRRNGPVYYDILRDGELNLRNFPYPVRRGYLEVVKRKKIAPYAMDGAYKFTLLSLSLYEGTYLAPLQVSDLNAKLTGTAYVWHPEPREFSVPTVRGHYSVVPAQWKKNVVTLRNVVVYPDQVYKTKHLMYAALHKVSSHVRFSTNQNDAVSYMTLNLQMKVLRGNTEALTPETFTKSNWRLLPGGFVLGAIPVLGSFSLTQFNEGMRFAFFEFVRRPTISPLAWSVLRDSGFIFFYSEGKFVLQDLYSHTGVVHCFMEELDLDFSYQVRHKSVGIAQDPSIDYEDMQRDQEQALARTQVQMEQMGKTLFFDE